MPASPLSSRTIGLLAESIDSAYTASQMAALFLKAEADTWQPQGAPNKLSRVMGLLNAMRSENSDASRKAALELARVTMARGKPQHVEYGDDRQAEWFDALRDALAADGWEFDADRDQLVPTVPGLEVSEEASWIERELMRRGWTVALGHYRQGIEAFAQGKWASANSQLRAFLEELMCQASSIPLGPPTGRVQRAVDALEKAGKLVDGEDEFTKKLWKLLHANGSHPGLSDEDESRFRLLTLTGYARYLLNRV